MTAAIASFMSPTVGTPTSNNWAWLCACRLISAGEGVPPERARQIEIFKHKIADTLEPFFRKPDKAKAERAMIAVTRVFLNSEWRALVSSEERVLETRFQIEAVITEAQSPFWR